LEVKASIHTTSPILTRENQKPVGMFHRKGISTYNDVGPLIGMVEVEGSPPPMLKPRISPQPKEDPNVGIIMDGMGI
jgi:hypothetical protein